MSVDTYLKGKRTSRYERVQVADVEVLLAPSLNDFGGNVTLDARGALFWRGFDVVVDHEHGPT